MQTNKYRRHGDDEEVDTFPVGDEVAVVKVERVARVFHQVNKTGSSEPNGDHDWDQLSEANRRRGLQHIQILQDVGKGHQTKST